MAPIDAVSSEILHQILGYLEPPDISEPSHDRRFDEEPGASLLKASLVCHRFRDTAIQYIFRQVLIRDKTENKDDVEVGDSKVDMPSVDRREAERLRLLMQRAQLALAVRYLEFDIPRRPEKLYGVQLQTLLPKVSNLKEFVWKADRTPSHTFISYLDKYCPYARLNVHHLSHRKLVWSSLMNSRSLYSFSCTAVSSVEDSFVHHDAMFGILQVIFSSPNLRKLRIQVEGENQKADGARSLRLYRSKFPLLETLVLHGPVFRLKDLEDLESCVDWRRLRVLKVGPYLAHKSFLERFQAQISSLQRFEVHQNGTEPLGAHRRLNISWDYRRGEDIREKNARPIYFSALLNLHKLTECLLENGADVNAYGGNLEYALHAAAYSHNMRDAQLLIERGASIHAQSRAMGNALAVATLRGNRDMVALFLDLGANFICPSLRFDDVIQIALSKFDEDMIRFLVARGAPIQVPRCIDRTVYPVPTSALRQAEEQRMARESHVSDLVQTVRHQPVEEATVPNLDNFSLDATSTWAGWYAHDRESFRHPTSLEISRLSVPPPRDETVFVGSGEDSVGLFSIHGRASLTGIISFVKLYQSFGWLYSGQLESDRKTLNGYWGHMRYQPSGIFQLVKV